MFILTIMPFYTGDKEKEAIWTKEREKKNLLF
jgi:hypothetical protein